MISIFQKSFQSDPNAFLFEAISFVFIICASLTLAINAADPDMKLVYPFFIIGNTLQAYAAYRRGSVWLLILTFYFTIINILGLCVSLTG